MESIGITIVHEDNTKLNTLMLNFIPVFSFSLYFILFHYWIAFFLPACHIYQLRGLRELKEENNKEILVTDNEYETRTEVEIRVFKKVFIEHLLCGRYRHKNECNSKSQLSWVFILVGGRNRVQNTTNNEIDDLSGGNKSYNKIEQGEKIRSDGVRGDGGALRRDQGGRNNSTLS